MAQKLNISRRKFVSEIVDIEELDRYKFNLIASGCGTGKSYFITHQLPKRLQDVLPEEIIFVTSRSLTVDQQAQYDGIKKFSPDDTDIINFWNSDDRIEDGVSGSGMRIMTYDKIISILLNNNSMGKETLSSVKVIVFDECHTLFSDTFIHGMEALQVWIRDLLYEGKKYVIGMTATPGILDYNAERWGVTIKELNDDVIIAHQASQMICTTFDTIPYLVTTNRLPGKTLIMCVTVKDCFKLQKQIPNSAILVSKNNKEFTPEMYMIRDYISTYEKLPDKFFVPSEAEMKCRAETKKLKDKTDKSKKENSDGTWYDLKVLITTTAAREGYNLSFDSGIRNIVSCFSDDLHLTQICGRARYDLDNIVVAKTYVPYDNTKRSAYLSQQRKDFDNYMSDKQNIKWFSSVEHLVKHDVYGIKRFFFGTDENRFIQYINSKWLVPIGTTPEETKKYRIWKNEDKDNIVRLCIQCKLLSVPDRLITFQRVIRLMEGCLGYSIDNGRFEMQKKSHSYKLVIEYDENNNTYADLFPTEDDLSTKYISNKVNSQVK